MNYIFKSKVENHQEIKEKLLQQINLIPQNPIIEDGDNIFHTDWNLPSAMHREYQNLFLETIKSHMINMCDELGLIYYRINQFWFQRYNQGGGHAMHTHPNCHFANVYFVECPKGYSTKFKSFEMECEEGDILSFPAFLPHMSPTIENNDMKTVIAFNSNFDVNPFPPLK